MDYRQTVLVTGAGRRLGFEVAKSLLEEGNIVFAHYRTFTDSVNWLEENGANCVQADFQRTEDVHDLIDVIGEKTTSLDAIIHIASSFGASQDLDAGGSEQLNSFFQIHMLAPCIINESLYPLLERSALKNASIVHVTDIFAARPDPQFHLYCATKAGLANLAKSYALRFSPAVRVNEIAPGPIKFAHSHTDNEKAAILDRTPLAREGGFQPVVSAIHHLLANDYLTGCCINVDGGRSIT